MKRDHGSVEAARRELVAHGYTLLHQLPHDPVGRWVRAKGKGPELAIGAEQRARSRVWHIVDAPPRPAVTH